MDDAPAEESDALLRLDPGLEDADDRALQLLDCAAGRGCRARAAADAETKASGRGEDEGEAEGEAEDEDEAEDEAEARASAASGGEAATAAAGEKGAAPAAPGDAPTGPTSVARSAAAILSRFLASSSSWQGGARGRRLRLLPSAPRAHSLGLPY